MGNHVTIHGTSRLTHLPQIRTHVEADVIIGHPLRYRVGLLARVRWVAACIGAVPGGDRPPSRCRWTSLCTMGVPSSRTSPRASTEVLTASCSCVEFSSVP